MIYVIKNLLSVNSIIGIFIPIYLILLMCLRNKFTNKLVWKILYFVPLLIGIIHFIVLYMHAYISFQMELYLYLYIACFISFIPQFLYKKDKAYIVVSIIIIIASVGLWFGNILSASMVPNLHNLSYLSYTESFKKSIEILKKEYSLVDHKKIDLDAIYNKYYPDIDKAEREHDELLYLRTLTKFEKEFKDNHFAAFPTVADFDYTLEIIKDINYSTNYYGFDTFMLTDGSIIAVDVLEDSPAYQQGLREGMTITKKNGVEINEVLKQTTFRSEPVLVSENMVNALFLFTYGDDTITVSFINDLGEEQTIEVYNYEESLTNSGYYDYKLSFEPYITNDEELENYYTKMLDDDTGYLLITDEMYNEFYCSLSYVTGRANYITKLMDKKLSDLKEQGMKDLIIDLRGNNGGYALEAIAVAEFFTDKSYTIANEYVKGLGDLHSNYKLNGNGKYKDMKVTVLINKECASAGDWLVDMLKKGDNTTVVGITDSNNIGQSTGGLIILSGGIAAIKYPIGMAYEPGSSKMYIDTDETRQARVTVDKRIEITKENFREIFAKPVETEKNYYDNINDDTELAYVLKYIH